MLRVFAMLGFVAIMIGANGASAHGASPGLAMSSQSGNAHELRGAYPRTHVCDTPADASTWHPPTDHEHGDPPPRWADEWSCESFGHPVIFGGDEATPNENQMKHEAYKGYAFTAQADISEYVHIFVRLHMASNPHERATRFHSYDMYVGLDRSNVSIWQGWLDFEPAPDNRDTHSDGRSHDLIPKYEPSNHIIGWDSGDNTFHEQSFDAYETGREFWYAQFSTETEWDTVFLIDTYDPATFTDPDTEHLDSMNHALWQPSGVFGLDRRLRVRWIVDGANTLTVAGRPYLTRNTLDPRGWFCTTPQGDITRNAVGDPSECSGDLPQFISPDMRTPGDTKAVPPEYRHTWTCGRCKLPN